MAHQTLVAFMAGTGARVDPSLPGYVEPNELGKIKTDLELDIDEAFQDLSKSLSQEQLRFSYDGCYRRGGWVFAYGVKEPAKHLYQKVKAQLADNDDTLTVVVTSHSRGCLSALLFAKRIQADAALLGRVKIIFDFRDPVPGNFQWSAPSRFTMAGQLSDCTHLTCVQKAHVTLFNKTHYSYGFDPLVPKFASNTEVEIDLVCGGHSAQQFNHYREHRQGNEPVPADMTYDLGFLKSQQIYAEQGIAVNRAAVAHRFPNFQFNTESNDAWLASIQQLQVNLYEALLDQQTVDPKAPQFRTLHFGGKIGPVTPVSDAKFLNARHVKLSQTMSPQKTASDPLLGYHGPKRYYVARDVLSAQYQQLIAECEFYKKKLDKKPIKHAEKILLMQEILETLKPANQKPYHQQDMLKTVEKVSQRITENSAIFNAPRDHEFRNRALHLTASIFTLGIYAGIRAIHSYRKRHSPKFWQSKSHIFAEHAEQAIKELDTAAKTR